MLRSYVRAATSSRRFQLFLVAHSLDKVARQRARAAAAAGAAAACLGAACLGAGTAAGSHICSARVGAARPIQSVLAHLRCGALRSSPKLRRCVPRCGDAGANAGFICVWCRRQKYSGEVCAGRCYAENVACGVHLSNTITTAAHAGGGRPRRTLGSGLVGGISVPCDASAGRSAGVCCVPAVRGQHAGLCCGWRARRLDHRSSLVPSSGGADVPRDSSGFVHRGLCDSCAHRRGGTIHTARSRAREGAPDKAAGVAGTAATPCSACVTAGAVATDGLLGLRQHVDTVPAQPNLRL
jgi:hypothetical protein